MRLLKSFGRALAVTGVFLFVIAVTIVLINIGQALYGGAGVILAISIPVLAFLTLVFYCERKD